MENQEPTVTAKKRLNLIGCVYYGDPFHSAEEWSQDNEIGGLWSRFMTLATTKYRSFMETVAREPNVSYELHLEPDDYADMKKYYVFVGIDAVEIANIPLEFFAKPLPMTQYLSFKTKGKGDEDAMRIISKYVRSDTSEYIQKYPYILQRYDESYKGFDNPESEIGWLVPVSPKSESGPRGGDHK